jgi:hypothetical protein
MGFRSVGACRRLLTRLTLWLLPILCAARLPAQDTRNEFWPEWDVYLKLNEKSRLFFLYSATKLDQRATYADGSLGGHLDFYTLPLLGRRLLQQHTDVARSKSFMLFICFPGLPPEAPTHLRNTLRPSRIIGAFPSWD